MLNQNLIKASNATLKQIDLVKFHEQSKQNLETEIQHYKIEAQKQRKIIYQLEKERESFIKELSELKEKVGTALCARGSFPSYSQNCEDDTLI
uniref:Cilia- and flagella-associated protein 58 central coiled coil domain-containing protein n=1 Tax=Geospiza parvula TaxID=87175 RepID=A0A8C3QBJ2_GEOPR